MKNLRQLLALAAVLAVGATNVAAQAPTAAAQARRTQQGALAVSGELGGDIGGEVKADGEADRRPRPTDRRQDVLPPQFAGDGVEEQPAGAVEAERAPAVVRELEPDRVGTFLALGLCLGGQRRRIAQRQARAAGRQPQLCRRRGPFARVSSSATFPSLIPAPIGRC